MQGAEVCASWGTASFSSLSFSHGRLMARAKMT